MLLVLLFPAVESPRAESCFAEPDYSVCLPCLFFPLVLSSAAYACAVRSLPRDGGRQRLVRAERRNVARPRDEAAHPQPLKMGVLVRSANVGRGVLEPRGHDRRVRLQVKFAILSTMLVPF